MPSFHSFYSNTLKRFLVDFVAAFISCYHVSCTIIHYCATEQYNFYHFRVTCDFIHVRWGRLKMHDLKMQDWKMTDNLARNRRVWKMQDWKMTDKILANSWQNYGV